MTVAGAGLAVVPVAWRDGTVRILDQTKLPDRERYIVARDVEAVVRAIRALAVRGAPLLGIAAGFGMALAARTAGRSRAGIMRELDRSARALIGSRPTAANIAWAVGRVCAATRRAAPSGGEALRRAALEEAFSIAGDEERSCTAIGTAGAELVPDGARILTHCNTGALATGGSGTAQGIIVAAHDAGKNVHVWVDETRPLLQGARLTAWELGRLGVPMTLVADSAAGSLMARGLVDLVVVGADRVAANGDVANKIGTYTLAVLASHHRIPFYVAAPISTVDAVARTGRDIVIEERDPGEVTSSLGTPVAPAGTPAANPAFDLTPARLVTAVVTDRGTARRPYGTSLRRLAALLGEK
jgi:methylthioribose-1-phosphate isomerase